MFELIHSPRYNPGTVIIFLSGQLYHSVGEWTVGSYVENDVLTLGCIRNVFFFPKTSFDKLYAKGPDWNWKMLSGTLPDVGKSKVNASRG